MTLLVAGDRLAILRVGIIKALQRFNVWLWCCRRIGEVTVPFTRVGASLGVTAAASAVDRIKGSLRSLVLRGDSAGRQSFGSFVVCRANQRCLWPRCGRAFGCLWSVNARGVGSGGEGGDGVLVMPDIKASTVGVGSREDGIFNHDVCGRCRTGSCCCCLLLPEAAASIGIPRQRLVVVLVWDRFVFVLSRSFSPFFLLALFSGWWVGELVGWWVGG